jgi:hypothetical protein
MREKRDLLITFLCVACLPMARPNCTSLTDGIDAYTLSAADGGLPAKCKVRLQSADCVTRCIFFPRLLRMYQ